jgi:fructose-bisphosphate aldolase, class I
MDKQEIERTAQELVAEGKGILAADESFGTIKKRFLNINIESTEESRRSYREMLFTTQGMEQFISGVILFDETLRQKTGQSNGGKPFPEVLAEKGVIPGIKVDKGTIPLTGYPGEKITEGLDGLRNRLDEYRALGARFTKWRAVITIGEDIPTPYCIDANAYLLARFASITQDAGLVPIVEPEVLMDGSHPIERCQEVTEATLQSVFDQLFQARVHLEGMLLKPNMVLPGKDSSSKASVEEVAEATVQTLRRVVPSAVPGIVFLSGGQTPEEATEHLNAMNAIGPHPWELSFSYGRALQDAALKTWVGQAANVSSGQQRFFEQAKATSAARYGQYSR